MVIVIAVYNALLPEFGYLFGAAISSDCWRSCLRNILQAQIYFAINAPYFHQYQILMPKTKLRSVTLSPAFRARSAVAPSLRDQFTPM